MISIFIRSMAKFKINLIGLGILIDIICTFMCKNENVLRFVNVIVNVLEFALRETWRQTKPELILYYTCSFYYATTLFLR